MSKREPAIDQLRHRNSAVLVLLHNRAFSRTISICQTLTCRRKNSHKAIQFVIFKFRHRAVLRVFREVAVCVIIETLLCSIEEHFFDDLIGIVQGELLTLNLFTFGVKYLAGQQVPGRIISVFDAPTVMVDKLCPQAGRLILILGSIFIRKTNF